MAFTKNFKIYMYIAATALLITACAKRDSEFAARKNAAGANYINDKQSAAADANAIANGVDTDIQQIQNPVATSNGGLSVSSLIRVNTQVYQVVTTHFSAGTISSTSANLNGATFDISGVCGSDVCNPYYLVVSISRNGQRIKQTAMKKYFFYTNAQSSQDLIMSLGPNEFMQVQDLIHTLDTTTLSQ